MCHQYTHTHPSPSQGPTTQPPSQSPLSFSQWLEALEPLLDIRVRSEVVATTFFLEAQQLREDSKLLGRSPQTAGAKLSAPDFTSLSPFLGQRGKPTTQPHPTLLSPSSACQN